MPVFGALVWGNGVEEWEHLVPKLFTRTVDVFHASMQWAYEETPGVLDVRMLRRLCARRAYEEIVLDEEKTVDPTSPSLVDASSETMLRSSSSKGFTVVR